MQYAFAMHESQLLKVCFTSLRARTSLRCQTVKSTAPICAIRKRSISRHNYTVSQYTREAEATRKRAWSNRLFAETDRGVCFNYQRRLISQWFLDSNDWSSNVSMSGFQQGQSVGDGEVCYPSRRGCGSHWGLATLRSCKCIELKRMAPVRRGKTKEAKESASKIVGERDDNEEENRQNGNTRVVVVVVLFQV